MRYEEWVARYPEAAAALHAVLMPACAPISLPEAGEAGVLADIRLEASEKGMRLWRNNVGAGTIAESGSFMRWGLCNDSKTVNDKIKSADGIGIEPVRITSDMVGQTIGRFLSRETKHSTWRYSGSHREMAQLAWANLIYSLGGNAAIVTGRGSL